VAARHCLASGDVNFSAAAPAGYSMNYTACGPVGGAQSVYDVRWNIQTPSTFVKLITVVGEAKRQREQCDAIFTPGDDSLDVRARKLT